jgi:hypothetical protein
MGSQILSSVRTWWQWTELLWYVQINMHDEIGKLSHGISDSFFSSYVVAMDGAALVCANKHA